jgi:hypothetical protein
MAGSTGPNIVKNKLVMYLDPNNTKSYISGSNYFYDLTSSDMDFTIQNSPLYIDGSLKYDGINNVVDRLISPSTNLDVGTDGAFSFGGWVKTESSTSYRWLILGAFSWTFNIQSNIITIRYISRNVINFNVTYTHDVWVNWFAVVDKPNNTIILYKNGEQIDISNSATATGAIGTGNSSIGEFSNSTNKFKGTIGPVYYYAKALTAAEIQQNYNAQKSRFGL